MSQSDKQQYQSDRAFYGLGFVSWAIYRVTWWGVWCIDRVLFRTRTVNLDVVPEKGPVLLLSNHVALLDPFQVALHMWRPSRFMAATSVLKIPFIGKWVAALGAFPKMKYVKDRDSMKTLAGYYEAGHVITLFPEGVRTWTGEPMPILPGIGRLIKRLNARVVYGRIRSGYLIAPRWARYPRYLPLDIEYIGPIEYGEDVTPEAITADVQEKLNVTPRRDPSRFAWGFRLAEGLPQLLWACPGCMAQEALEVPETDRDTVRCGACERSWRIDLDAVMHGIDGGAETMPIATAHQLLNEHYGSPLVLNRDNAVNPTASTAGTDPLLARHPCATVSLVPKVGEPTVVACGELLVHSTHISIAGSDPDAGWSSTFDDILAVSTEVGDQLFVRRRNSTAHGDLFRLEVPNESPYKWGCLLQGWLRHHKPMQ